MQCPYCKETIQDQAIVCRFCNAYRSGERWERQTPGRPPNGAPAPLIRDEVVSSPAQAHSRPLPIKKPGSVIKLVITWFVLAVIVIALGCITLVVLFGKSTSSSPGTTTGYGPPSVKVTEVSTADQARLISECSFEGYPGNVCGCVVVELEAQFDQPELGRIVEQAMKPLPAVSPEANAALQTCAQRLGYVSK